MVRKKDHFFRKRQRTIKFYTKWTLRNQLEFWEEFSFLFKKKKWVDFGLLALWKTIRDGRAIGSFRNIIIMRFGFSLFFFQEWNRVGKVRFAYSSLRSIRCIQVDPWKSKGTLRGLFHEGPLICLSSLFVLETASGRQGEKPLVW